MTIGTRGSRARISRTTSKPLFPGMFQSVKTRSNPLPALNSSIACKPSAASTAPVTPKLSSERRMIVRIVPESSAKRTRMIVVAPLREKWQCLAANGFVLASDETHSDVEKAEIYRPPASDFGIQRGHDSGGRAERHFDFCADAKDGLGPHERGRIREQPRQEHGRRHNSQTRLGHVPRGHVKYLP